jgi:hypothetical protein
LAAIFNFTPTRPQISARAQPRGHFFHFARHQLLSIIQITTFHASRRPSADCCEAFTLQADPTAVNFPAVTGFAWLTSTRVSL